VALPQDGVGSLDGDETAAARADEGKEFRAHGRMAVRLMIMKLNWTDLMSRRREPWGRSSVAQV
jgi:hypothetical protein